MEATKTITLEELLKRAKVRSGLTKKTAGEVRWGWVTWLTLSGERRVESCFADEAAARQHASDKLEIEAFRLGLEVLRSKS